jgi:hypothetical protein
VTNGQGGRSDSKQATKAGPAALLVRRERSGAARCSSSIPGKRRGAASCPIWFAANGLRAASCSSRFTANGLRAASCSSRFTANAPGAAGCSPRFAANVSGAAGCSPWFAANDPEQLAALSRALRPIRSMFSETGRRSAPRRADPPTERSNFLLLGFLSCRSLTERKSLGR